ncbi:MAG: hypothetical protein H7338_06915 [Candidatus Sericytochromatia bacterium]|nr:hypothetical protein [Candidatus Sericytochromatia bacterium]
MTPAQPGPVLRGLTTVLPDHVWEQETLYQTLFSRHFGRHPKAHEIFQNAAVAKRHFALDLPTFLASQQTTATRSDAYLQAAMQLGGQACREALYKTGLIGSDIDFFVVASCTGFAMPDLDVLLGPSLGLKRQVTRLTIGETGSHAALPAIARACDHVRAYPHHRALVLVVEICSANVQLDCIGENIVSAAIFGDGASALIIEGSDCAGPGLSVLAAGSSTYFEAAAEMTYRFEPDGAHFHLGRRVPEVLATGMAESIDTFLADQGLRRSDITRWVHHPGGRLILDLIEKALDFQADELASSRRVLNQVGNLAASTVLFVLEESFRAKPLVPGERILMAGYGPGLGIEMLLMTA